MNKEYIARETAINDIEETSCYLCKKYIGTKKCDCDCEIWRNKKMLHDIPAADVKPVIHAHWVSVPHKKSRICSHCACDEPYKFANVYADVYNFCPNCGADMRKEVNNE